MAPSEQAYPEHTPLSLPERHPDYPRYQSLLRLERRLFGDWLQWLTNSWCAAAFAQPNHDCTMTEHLQSNTPVHLEAQITYSTPAQLTNRQLHT